MIHATAVCATATYTCAFPLRTQAYGGKDASLKALLQAGSKVVKSGAQGIMRSAASNFFLQMEIRSNWYYLDNSMSVGTGNPFLSLQVRRP